MTTPNERPALASETTPATEVPPAAPPAPTSILGMSIENGAHRLDAQAQSLGREAEAAVARLSENPAVRETMDLGARLWGVVLLGFGFWFLADVTLGLEMPAVSWGDLWPVALIVIGLLVALRGRDRRA